MAMDGDGLAFFILWLMIAFLAGVTFGVCMIKYDKSKPPIDEETVILRLKDEIRQMSIESFAHWLRN